MPECVGACTCAQHVFRELQKTQQHSTEPSCVSLVKDDTQLLHYRKKWEKIHVWESQPMFDFSDGPR